MSLIRKHVAVLQAWACLALVFCSQTAQRTSCQPWSAMFSYILKHSSSFPFLWLCL